MLTLPTWRNAVDESIKQTKKDQQLLDLDENRALIWIIGLVLIPLIMQFKEASKKDSARVVLQIILGKSTSKIEQTIDNPRYYNPLPNNLQNIIAEDLRDVDFRGECLAIIHYLNIVDFVSLKDIEFESEGKRQSISNYLNSNFSPINTHVASQVHFGIGNSFQNATIEGIAGHTYVRQQINYHIHYSNIENNLKEADLEIPDFVTTLQAYAEWIKTNYSTLNLGSIRASKVVDIDLEKTYTSLRSTRIQQISEETPTLLKTETTRQIRISDSIGEIFLAYQKLILTGSPGSGKTTFLTYLAISFAREILGEKVLAGRFGFDESLLPVLVPLREFFDYISELKPSQLIGSQLFLDYIKAKFDNLKLDFPLSVLEAYLNKGKAILLLDGLDEVADIKDRAVVTDIIRHLSNKYPNCRYVVSCRTHGYEGAVRLGDNFFVSELQELNDNEIRTFLENFYTSLHNHSLPDIMIPQNKAEELHKLMTRNPKIRELAATPLLLTVIATLFQNTDLPKRRVQLYGECIDILLGYWDAGKEGKISKQLAEYIDKNIRLDFSEKRLLLEPIALYLQERRRRVIDEDSLIKQLSGIFAELGLQGEKVTKYVEAFLNTIQIRSGLLKEIERGSYTFAHLSFQEFLSARAVIGREDYADYLLSRLGDSWWREVILLAASQLSSSSRLRASKFIDEIINAESHDFEANAQHLILAAECMLDAGRLRVDTSVWDNLVKAIIQKMTSRACSLNTRYRLGSVLGSLGDPRNLDELVFIPGGKYWIGSTEADIQYALEVTQQHFKDKELISIFENLFRSELGRYEVETKSYMITKYPVTNQSYQKFVIDRGIEGPSKSEPWALNYNWHGVNYPIGRANHPVVLITFEQAVEYCRWLSEKNGRLYRLPTGEEWEIAATGRNDYRYTWGPNFELFANTAESGLQDTTSVGIFEEGKSPFGVYDLLGNCWEWTSDWFKPYPNNAHHSHDAYGELFKITRGGSWFTYGNYARARSRYPFHDKVDYRGVSPIGFRYVEEII
jgi:formylglycine-generating enzyme required for sulfatase activity